MMKNKNYDIFISYRREGGYEIAQQISQYLKYKGYNVFFDLENLRGSGKFDTQLFSIIESCKDFIIVFPTTDMNRLWNEDDWVRLELACAIRNGKNIVPILLRDFKFPKELPDDINEVRLYQGVAAGDHNFFDASMEKLRHLLVSKRGFTWKRYKIAIFTFVGVLTTVLSALTFVWWNNQTEFKTLSKDVCSVMGSEIIMVNGVVGEINEMETDWKNYTSRLGRVNSMEEAEKLYSEFSNRVQYNINKKRNYRKEYILNDNERKLMRKNKIEVEDVQGFFSICLSGFYEEINKSFNNLLLYASPKSYLIDSESNNHFVELDFKCNRLSAESIYLTYLGMMSLMPAKETTPIIDKIKINLYNLPHVDNDKPYTYYENRLQNINAEMAELVAKSDNVVRREQDVVNRVEAFVKDARSKQQVKKKLEEIEGKKVAVAEIKAKYSETDKRLTEAYERILVKFAIKADDAQLLQWGKMLRIATLANNALTSRTEAKKQYEEQVRIARNQDLDPSFLTLPYYTISVDEMFGNVDKWLSTYQKNFSSESKYVAQARQYYKAVREGRVPHVGVIIVGTKDNLPHPVYKVGDIVVERKGQTIRNSDHYSSLANDLAINSVKILRFSSDGTAQYVTETIPADCKVLVGILDLTESE